MNELQVKTIELEPARIEFNHEDIERELEISLKKYEGLVFSEDSATDLRKTIAELRKGKKAVDRYRIDTKKELNSPIVEFESKCKELDERFNNVINPLAEQQEEFEEIRRAEKLEVLEEARKELIKKHELDDEYAAQVEIEDSLLTKSTTEKVAKESIEFIIKNFKMEQDKKAADLEIIETNVNLANAENNMNLSVGAYVRLLDFDDVKQVKQQIAVDVEKAKEKVAAERERLIEEVKPIIEDVPVDEPVHFENDFMPDPFADPERKKEVTYIVYATDVEHEEIKNLLSGLDVAVSYLE